MYRCKKCGRNFTTPVWSDKPVYKEPKVKPYKILRMEVIHKCPECGSEDIEGGY